jgi:hypothetical protein
MEMHCSYSVLGIQHSSPIRTILGNHPHQDSKGHGVGGHVRRAASAVLWLCSGLAQSRSSSCIRFYVCGQGAQVAGLQGCTDWSAEQVLRRVGWSQGGSRLAAAGLDLPLCFCLVSKDRGSQRGETNKDNDSNKIPDSETPRKYILLH